jgi:ABC-type uncharacterized transport system auxiliary subunit
MNRAKKLMCLAVLLTLWSCLGRTVPPERIKQYVLEYAPPNVSGLAPLNVVIRVDRFTAAAPYNQEILLYREKAYLRQSDYYHRWRVLPAVMLSDFIARDLRNSSTYRAVLRHDSFNKADFRLEGDLTEFLEEDLEDARYAVLAVDVILVDESTSDSSRWVVWQKHYRVREQCRVEGTQGLVEAMSRAMATFSQQLGTDIYNGISKRLGQSSAEAGGIH